MAKKNKIFLLLFFIINIAYVLFLVVTNIIEVDNNQQPVIKFDEEIITISVKDDEKELLRGVNAFDEEDGDLSNQVFIYSVGRFNENQERTVTYAVFDTNNQMVTAARKYKYYDYIPPKFSSKKPLTSLMSSLLSGGNGVSMMATSSVDGDITNKISMVQSESNGSITYQYSVTDSTGTSESLAISEEISLKGLMMNVSIELSDYIIYLEKGTVVDFRNYINDIKTSVGYQPKLIGSVQIETNYNASESGLYEVMFTLNRTNGDYGAVKMFVIVED